MRIDFDAVLVDAEDKPILDGEAPVSVLTLLKRAILADITADRQPVSADEKIARFELFLKLKFANNETSFTLDEVKLLDKAILVYPTLTAGQLHYILTQK